MRASNTAVGQDETDDAKYLPWKLYTESDMTKIFLLGNIPSPNGIIEEYRRWDGILSKEHLW